MGDVHFSDPAPVKETRTILLVEDNSAILSLFSEALTQEGFTVLSGRTVRDALHLSTQHKGAIHLLVVDLLLPSHDTLQIQDASQSRTQMTGLDLMRQLVGQRPEMQILLISGRPDQELHALGAFREGKPLLRKPLGVETLVSTVQQMLNGSS